MNEMLKILQHSLGLDEYGQGNQFRNHFVAGGKDLEVCRQAVIEGFMVERQATSVSGGSPWFSVTPAGIDHVALTSPVRPPAPKVSRSKQRYQRYREYGEGFDSFLDFCYWDAQPERSWNGGY